MFKDFCNIIDKFFFPSRFARGLSCNDGVWWWIPAAANAIGSAAGAIGSAAGAVGGAIGSAAGAVGSAVGSAASAIGSGIGSALGMGGTAAASGSAAIPSLGISAAAPIGSVSGAGAAATSLAPTVGSAGTIGSLATPVASVLTPGGLAGAQAAIPLANAAPTIGGTVLPGSAEALLLKAGINPVTTDAAKSAFNLKDIAKLAVKELTPFGDMMEGGITPETVSKTTVKMASGSKDKQQPVQLPDVSNSNSFSGQSPNFVQSDKAPTSGAQAVSPEMMMQIMQMMKLQQAQGGTRPIAKGNFPGGYY